MDIQSSYRIPVNTITWHLAEKRKLKLPLVRKEEERVEIKPTAKNISHALFYSSQTPPPSWTQSSCYHSNNGNRIVLGDQFLQLKFKLDSFQKLEEKKNSKWILFKNWKKKLNWTFPEEYKIEKKTTTFFIGREHILFFVCLFEYGNKTKIFFLRNDVYVCGSFILDKTYRFCWSRDVSLI